ncbi:LysE family translocator [Corynebacterium doosanense]|uniref:Threonine transporter n=1 Tax=Corynebacterium doosanense CAU 212 = DSM 45436 TaxID=558173 RepID=A0A097IIL8_9CORY|nr:LysE family translocator [Corynebacterium doosanense]AIT61968.1 threonine transporter [Corynebacterium doosanense CAU 212 = DSM 45436]
MSAAAFASLLAIWIPTIIAPGPDTVQILRLSMKSRRAGVLCALGISTAIAIWIAASLLGLSALVNAYPAVLRVLQIVGGCYLVYMGVQSIRSGLRQRGSVVTHAPGVDVSAGQAFRIGLWTNLSNPKAVLFFGAIFAQFIRPGMGAGWAFAIFATLVALAIVVFTAMALGVNAASRFLGRAAPYIDIVAGVVFLCVAVWMIYEGVTG